MPQQIETWLIDPKTKRERRAFVLMDNPPLDMIERRKRIESMAQAGDYDWAPPTTGEMVTGLATGIGQFGAEVGPSLVGIGMGSARGAQYGAQFGPWGAAAGGLGGAMLGGIAGLAGTNLIDLTRRAIQGEPQRAPLDVMQETLVQGAKTGAEAELLGYPFRVAGAAWRGAEMSLEHAKALLAARANGIDLTMAETADRPFLRLAESITARHMTGAGPFEQMAVKQSKQMRGAFQAFGEREFGATLEAGGRSNRFLGLMKSRVNDLRSQAGQLFEQWIAQAGGPRTPVVLQPLYDAAYAIRMQQSVLPSVQNPKLVKMLGDIESLRSQGFKDLPLAQMKLLRTQLGEIGYPSPLAGAVTVDAPVAAARQLRKGLDVALTAHADATATRPLFDASNQLYSRIHRQFDNTLYRGLLSGDKTLGEFSRRLFNARDPGLLIDAKAAVTDDGWKLLQQQYWDDVFTSSRVALPSGGHGFNGAKFADRIARDQNVLKHLVGPEQLEAINDFASATQLAARANTISASNAMGIFVGGGDLVAIAGVPALLATGHPIAAAGTAVSAAAVPYFFAKVMTNPSAARMVGNWFSRGRIEPGGLERVMRFLATATAATVEREGVRVSPLETQR